MTLEDIKNNRELRPYFLEVASKYIALRGAAILTVNKSDMRRLHKDFSKSFKVLSEHLGSYVEPERVDHVIEHVGFYYISVVQFDNYSTSTISR